MQFSKFMAEQPQSLVIMEACVSATHSGWELGQLVHEAKEIVPSLDETEQSARCLQTMPCVWPIKELVLATFALDLPQSKAG